MTTLNETLALIDRDAAERRQRAIAAATALQAELDAITETTTLEQERAAAGAAIQADVDRWNADQLPALQGRFAELTARSAQLRAHAEKLEAAKTELEAGAESLHTDLDSAITDFVKQRLSVADCAGIDQQAAADLINDELDSMVYACRLIIPGWINTLKRLGNQYNIASTTPEGTMYQARMVAMDAAKRKR